jgi:hypothetical protein
VRLLAGWSQVGETGKPLTSFYVAQAFTPGLWARICSLAPFTGLLCKHGPAKAPARKPLKGLIKMVGLALPGVNAWAKEKILAPLFV